MIRFYNDHPQRQVKGRHGWIPAAPADCEGISWLGPGPFLYNLHTICFRIFFRPHTRPTLPASTVDCGKPLHKL